MNGLSEGKGLPLSLAAPHSSLSLTLEKGCLGLFLSGEDESPAAVAWAPCQRKSKCGRRGARRLECPLRAGRAYPPSTQPGFPLLGSESPRIKCSYRALWELADPILASASRKHLRTCQGKDVLSTLTQFPIFQR